MIDASRELDMMEIECDGENCTSSFDMDGTYFKDATEEMKRKGWKIKKIGYEWKHFCQDCVERSETKTIW